MHVGHVLHRQVDQLVGSLQQELQLGWWRHALASPLGVAAGLVLLLLGVQRMRTN